MSSNLSVPEVIRQYALPCQRLQAEGKRKYPYPEADGSELCIALKNAASNCDNAALGVLLHELQYGRFGQSEGNREARIACIREVGEKIKKLPFPDSRCDTVLKRLTDAKEFLEDLKQEKLEKLEDAEFWHKQCREKYCWDEYDQRP